MILDGLKCSLNAPGKLIPVAALLASCAGSRMPEVCPEELTPEAAGKAVEVCPTDALQLEMRHGREHLRLDYGECIGCGRCNEAAPKAFIPATRFARTGVARAELVRMWDLETKTELPSGPQPDSVSTARPMARPSAGLSRPGIACMVAQRGVGSLARWAAGEGGGRPRGPAGRLWECAQA